MLLFQCLYSVSFLNRKLVSAEGKPAKASRIRGAASYVFDGFTVVLVYTLVFCRCGRRGLACITLYDETENYDAGCGRGVGSLLVPAVACSIVWMIFAILNLPVVTVVFTALTLFLAASAMVQFVQILYKSAEKPAADVMYCISAAVIIMLVLRL